MTTQTHCIICENFSRGGRAWCTECPGYPTFHAVVYGVEKTKQGFSCDKSSAENQDQTAVSNNSKEPCFRASLTGKKRYKIV